MKRRKITGSAHVEVVTQPVKADRTARPELLPAFSRKVWDELEAAFGGDFGKQTRDAIWSAAERYEISVLQNDAGHERAKLRGRKKDGKQHETSPLTKLERALSDCVTIWREADADEASAMALAEIPEIDLTSLRADLEATAVALRIWLRRMEDDLQRETSSFDRLVADIAEILEAAGEHVTAHGAAYEKKPPSPFQNFMAHLNKILPHPESASSDEALASRVTRALAKR